MNQKRGKPIIVQFSSGCLAEEREGIGALKWRGASEVFLEWRQAEISARGTRWAKEFAVSTVTGRSSWLCEREKDKRRDSVERCRKDGD